MKSFFAPMISAFEFEGFWIEPDTDYYSQEFVKAEDGAYHIGRILKPNPGAAHRAYAAWQPWKAGEAFGPCVASLDFKYAMPTRKAGQWVSLLTLSKNAGDGAWDPVTINIDERGALGLMHTPRNGKEIYTQVGNVRVSQNQWNHLDVQIDFRPAGSIVVSLNGVPGLYGVVQGGDGYLYQAHPGLYADGTIGSGWVANSNFRVQELSLEREIHS